MKKNNKRSWILWLYIALLCCFIGAGIVYCAGMVEPEPSVGTHIYAEGEELVDVDEVIVPMGDAE